jgi:hypothetical protein
MVLIRPSGSIVSSAVSLSPMYREPWEIPPDIVDTLAKMVDKGYEKRLRPLAGPDGKRLAFRENGSFTLQRLEYLVGRCRMNLGLRLHGGLVVVDVDGPNLGPLCDVRSDMFIYTGGRKSGVHHYFRTDSDHPNLIHPCGLDVDLLFHSVPPLHTSTNRMTGEEYILGGVVLREEQLPLFPMEILQEFDPPPARPRQLLSRRRVLGEIHDIRAYIATIFAIEGQGGDKVTFRVACLIARATGGDYHETLELLREWNETNAHPRWSEKELANKVKWALRTVGRAA